MVGEKYLLTPLRTKSTLEKSNNIMKNKHNLFPIFLVKILSIPSHKNMNLKSLGILGFLTNNGH